MMVAKLNPPFHQAQKVCRGRGVRNLKSGYELKKERTNHFNPTERARERTMMIRFGKHKGRDSNDLTLDQLGGVYGGANTSKKVTREYVNELRETLANRKRFPPTDRFMVSERTYEQRVAGIAAYRLKHANNLDPSQPIDESGERTNED